MEEKKDILRRVYIVYGLCCLFALTIIGRVCYIQFVQGEYWKAEAELHSIQEIDIEAARGNIFAVDGKTVLAISLPYYEVAIDPHANKAIDNAEFEDSARALSNSLAALLPAKDADTYYRSIMKARRDSAHYLLVARNVSQDQIEQIKTFPLFRLGQYQGGLLYTQTNKRERPFRMLASRTIGYIGDSGRVRVGLEGAYDSILTGVSGKRLMRRITGGVWMPLDEDNVIDPKHGRDIVTTIDINIQGVAENALLNSLAEHNAKYGCVILMEVETGEIRAIANLTRRDSGEYVEDFNYAIADAQEPGSTFKLASYLVAMDDGKLQLDDEVDLNGGSCKYYDRTMHDSHSPKKEVVSAEEAFWESSNVGISRLITNAYKGEPRKFTDGIHRLRFGELLGIEIKGEGNSLVKNAGDSTWSGTSLPWMSIGYECLITPMQTLTLYNAVANDGKMMKPMFVKEVRDKGQTVQSFDPVVLNPAIAKPETIEKAQKLLEGVVQNGTAKSMKNTVYTIAGKTGTAQIANGSAYKGVNGVTYQASFVGYFPADKPKYTCIVIVNAPSNDVYYGGLVAGPIFKQIADRVYATQADIHIPVNFQKDTVHQQPVVKKGLTSPTLAAIAFLHGKVNGTGTIGNSDFITVQAADKSLEVKGSTPDEQLQKGVMPDMRGMNASDAVFLLENRGIKVKVKGAGTVRKQSVNTGERISMGNEVVLELSI
jgi:cell division protein FtsI (penicillin-binding protein 3)